MSDPVISIVIVSWNVRDLLRTCLKSLQRYVRQPYEVVVVDNNSSDGTVAMLRSEFPDIQVVANDHNAGFARANNQGWQRTHGRYVCFLNPDTECINDPFPVLLREAAEPQVGCVAPQLLNPDRSHQPSVRRFPTFADQALILLKLRWFKRWLPALRDYHMETVGSGTIPVDQVMGAMMLMPRSVLTDAGSFDEGYWIWFEEVDLCRRLVTHGYEIRYVPEATILHHGGQSFRQHISLAKHVWFMKSLARYARLHWSRSAYVGIVLLMPISYLLTMIQSFIKPR